jgi:hypothetical protein
MKQNEQNNLSQLKFMPTLKESIKRAYSIEPELLLKEKKISMKSRVLKRMSPFLLLVVFLLVLFPYLLITGKGAVTNFWILIFLFPFTIINVLFFDFALWNYFEGKKKLLIWIIEFTLSFFIVYFLM